jgi:DNA-binding transcriptional regulator YiaG
MTPADLKSARKTLGLGAGRFADILGIDISSVRKYESGARPIPAWLEIVVDLLMNVPSARKRLGL